MKPAKLTRLIALSFFAVLVSVQAQAFNPSQSAQCQAHTQALLEQAHSKNKQSLIRIKPLEGTRVEANGKPTTLRQAILNAKPDSLLLLEKGMYPLPVSQSGNEYTGLYIKNAGITLMGNSANANDVIIETNYQDLGQTSGIVSVSGANVTIANLTLKRSIFHLIHLWNGADNPLIHNVNLIDGGQQFLKASPGKGTIQGGEVRCSQFLMTDAGRDNVWGYGKAKGWTTCYTGGIDTHSSYNWTIKNNRFEGIYCNADGVQRPAHQQKAKHRDNQSYVGGLSEHAIHMWHSIEGTQHIIENNQIIDCARGIGIGLMDKVYGGIVRNNMISSRFPGAKEHDVGIALYNAIGAKVLNNTIYYSHPSSYQNTIEALHKESSKNLITNNLTNRNIRLRSGAEATLQKNETRAGKRWFVDIDNNDLHLASCVYHPEIIGQGIELSEIQTDIDGDSRGKKPDIGADQCNADRSS